MNIDAEGIYYRQLNERIRQAVADGVSEFTLTNVKGQRYIATGLKGEHLKFVIHGTPGQDLAAFMQGPTVRVEGNTQDGVGNTMDRGRISVNGMTGDVLGYGMRGGHIFVHRDVGYRVGIHMKSFKDKVPVIVIGGKAGDFLGEYMAGGAIILLGSFSWRQNAPISGSSLGTGMHGGVIYTRGKVPEEQLGPGLKTEPVSPEDLDVIRCNVAEFAREFDEDPTRIMDAEFYKVAPFSHRPYGNMYCPC